MAGISVLLEKPEDASTYYTEMIQGGSKRVDPLTYSLGIRTSKELYDDDKYGLVGQKGPMLLARSAAFTKEMIAWNVFNQGFTSAVTTFDGNPLSTMHMLCRRRSGYTDRSWSRGCYLGAGHLSQSSGGGY